MFTIHQKKFNHNNKPQELIKEKVGIPATFPFDSWPSYNKTRGNKDELVSAENYC
jgi:hypothetical protein